MEYKSELITDVAMLDNDFALKGIISLNEDGPPEHSSTDDVVEWAHYLCTYSRFVHLNTWTDHESIKRVTKEFIPEFKRAQNYMDELLDRKEDFGFNDEQLAKLELYRAHIKARLNNLKNNYCLGLDTAFEPSSEYPPTHLGPWKERGC